LINDVLKIGDKIKVSFLKTPLTIIEAGKCSAVAEGNRGGKYMLYWRGYDQKIVCGDEVINI
jgi:hypothetical protein